MSCQFISIHFYFLPCKPDNLSMHCFLGILAVYGCVYCRADECCSRRTYYPRHQKRWFLPLSYCNRWCIPCRNTGLRFRLDTNVILLYKFVYIYVFTDSSKYMTYVFISVIADSGKNMLSVWINGWCNVCLSFIKSECWYSMFMSFIFCHNKNILLCWHLCSFIWDFFLSEFMQSM